MLDIIKQPWPWYIAGPLIGLVIPVLLVLGNKSFGISSSFRHICASCIPAGIPFFKYDWRKEIWNLVFVAGIVLGGLLAARLLANPEPLKLNPALAAELATYGITNHDNFIPAEILNWTSLFSPRGFIMLILGGFLIGFGTRYAGGCTSGHAIMGLSNLQVPSLIATVSFLAGGLLMTNLLLPLILSLK